MAGKSATASGFLPSHRLSSPAMNLAIFGIDVANAIIQAHPNINKWTIGGHSLGGAMAAEFVSTNPDSVEGLFLWAAYSAKNTDLSEFTNHKVLSVFGEKDYTVENIRASRKRLPPNTRWVEMQGANHGQFGWYGEHPGDGEANISREEQQKRILKYTFEFLSELNKD